MNNDGGNDVREAGTQSRAFWKAKMEKMTDWPRLSTEHCAHDFNVLRGRRRGDVRLLRQAPDGAMVSEDVYWQVLRRPCPLSWLL